MAPEAPGWLMMTMVWPSDFSISPATSRVIWSVEPPAAHGTIRLIGRVGFQSAAAAGKANKPQPAANRTTTTRRFLTHHSMMSVCFAGLYSQPSARANSANHAGIFGVDRHARA